MRRQTVAAIVAALITCATLMAQGAIRPLPPEPLRALPERGQGVISPLPPLPPSGFPEITPSSTHDADLMEIRRALEATVLQRGTLQAQPSSGASQQPGEFTAISELPPDEKLPAAPMLVAAYVFVLLAFFAYVLSLARRMRSVTKEIERLETELKRHPPR